MVNICLASFKVGCGDMCIYLQENIHSMLPENNGSQMSVNTLNIISHHGKCYIREWDISDAIFYLWGYHESFFFPKKKLNTLLKIHCINSQLLIYISFQFSLPSIMLITYCKARISEQISWSFLPLYMISYYRFISPVLVTIPRGW